MSSLDSVTDQGALQRIALTDPASSVRRDAMERVADVQVLTFIASTDPHLLGAGLERCPGVDISEFTRAIHRCTAFFTSTDALEDGWDQTTVFWQNALAIAAFIRPTPGGVAEAAIDFNHRMAHAIAHLNAPEVVVGLALIHSRPSDAMFTPARQRLVALYADPDMGALEPRALVKRATSCALAPLRAISCRPLTQPRRVATVWPSEPDELCEWISAEYMVYEIARNHSVQVERVRAIASLTSDLFLYDRAQAASSDDERGAALEALRRSNPILIEDIIRATTLDAVRTTAERYSVERSQ